MGFGGFLKGLGQVAKAAAPVVGMVPGVGTLAAAGLGAGGGLLAGEGLRGALTGGLAGAAGGLLGGSGALGRLGGVGEAIQGIGSFARSNPALVLGGLSALQSARDRSKQQGVINEQLGAQREALARQRMFQDKAVSGLGPVGRKDLSGVFRDPSNVFS